MESLDNLLSNNSFEVSVGEIPNVKAVVVQSKVQQTTKGDIDEVLGVLNLWVKTSFEEKCNFMFWFDLKTFPSNFFEFVSKLSVFFGAVSEELKEELKNISPSNYLGIQMVY